MSAVRVFVPGSIGNVGPGFDMLGLAVDGIGDAVTLELTQGPSAIGSVSGRDAELIPRDPAKNCAVIAAESYLRRAAVSGNPVVAFERRLPLSGGLGSSAAASVAGAFAAAVVSGGLAGPTVATASSEVRRWILEAALDGEEAVAGRHLDNIAPCLLGGLCLARGTSPVDAVQLQVRGSWWLTVVSPRLRLATKDARAVLPTTVERKLFIEQMANTAGVIAAFAAGDAALMRRSLHDHFAEPRRAPLIQNFDRVKTSALDAGALGCSISGAGPTIFALSSDLAAAQASAEAMRAAFAPVGSEAHVGLVDQVGARVVSGASTP